MAFKCSRTYAQLWHLDSLPEKVDSFWYVTDNNLKGVFEPCPQVQKSSTNKEEYLFFSQELNTIISLTQTINFRPLLSQSLHQ